MSATALLDRLERVRQTGPGSWIARCPAHEDRSPSLSIRETDGGTILIKCFAGCGAIAVIEALGLTWAALFPERLAQPDGISSRWRNRPPAIPARDLLEIISEETAVLEVIAADMCEHKTVSEQDFQRLMVAAARIHSARDHMHAR